MPGITRVVDMKILDRFLRLVNSALRWITLVLFSLMALCVLLQVVLRYLITIPFPWTEEAARFFFIWATFAGAALAFREGGHLNVGFFVKLVPTARVRALLSLLADACCFWFLGMYVKEGFILSSRLTMMGQTPPSMDFLLMGWVYLAIPLGSLLMMLNLLPGCIAHLVTLFTGTVPEGDNA